MCTLVVMGEDRLTGDSSPVNRRLTVSEAAAQLGITEAAVRGRIKRDTLGVYREAGTVYVLLPGDEPAVNRDEPADQQADQSALVESLQEQVAYLRGVIATRDRDLEARTEEIRRKDRQLENQQHLMGMQAERVRELESRGQPGQPEQVQETPHDRPGEAGEGAGGVEDRVDRGEAQTGAEDRGRSWFERVRRRFFG